MTACSCSPMGQETASVCPCRGDVLKVLARVLDYTTEPEVSHHARVAAVPGEPFGADDHIRFSYATSMKRIEEGMARLGRVVARRMS